MQFIALFKPSQNIKNHYNKTKRLTEIIQSFFLTVFDNFSLLFLNNAKENSNSIYSSSLCICQTNSRKTESQRKNKIIVFKQNFFY